MGFKMNEKHIDRRVQRSRQNIINAFLELRSKMDLEKITVTELCKKAEINKSTFYVHYHDLYDLSEQLETEIVTGILESLEQPEKAFEDTERFTRNLFMAYDSKKNMINILFSGSRSSELPKKVEASIMELLFEIKPEYRDDPKRAIEFAYLIYGSFYAYETNKHLDQDFVISILAGMSGRFIQTENLEIKEPVFDDSEKQTTTKQ